ncbi:STN domain-containing protein, partial [Klebsiella pneumoniae]|uniref:STN domain-containing protein n=1 Tax=Klebsiella pneumoniae TaxID=573 RepID=UPI001F1953D4
MNNKKKTLKRSLLALLISTIAAPCAYASTVSVALPEQSLADSLSAIAKQGQVQILFDANSVKNLRAPALSGQFETQTALQKVLIGSGLEIIPQGSGFVIRPLATANTIVIPEVKVTDVGSTYHPATDVVSA